MLVSTLTELKLLFLFIFYFLFFFGGVINFGYFFFNFQGCFQLSRGVGAGSKSLEMIILIQISGGK